MCILCMILLVVIVIVMLARDCYNSLSLITEISQIRNYIQKVVSQTNLTYWNIVIAL